MDVHEVCNIFPLMSPDEFAGLKADIAANGQREPVWTHEGKVIDGRNRLRACQELGVEPRVREWDGKGSLVAFVVGLNLHRRHLSSSQRAACGLEAEERLAAEAKDRQRAAGPVAAARHAASINGNSSHKGRPTKEVVATTVVEIVPQPSIPKAREGAAKLVGTNPRYIQDAKVVKAAAPELHEKVKAGTITLPQAKREVARAEKRVELETKAAAVQAESETQTWEVVEADCVEMMVRVDEVIHRWPWGRPRLIFADPPYNIGVDYGHGHDDAMEQEDFIDWCKSWINAGARLLAPDGSFWLLINDEWADIIGCLLRDAGLHRRAWIKWYESFGVNCSKNFNRTSRHLFYCVRDPKRFVFNEDAVVRPSDRQLKYNDSRADPGGKRWGDVWGIPWDEEGHGSIPRLVDNSAERLPDFPTQLPLKLLLPIVGCASDPGDLILDPFNGSGTTGEAAIRLGRRYVGIERSPDFARMARLRLKAAAGEVRP